MKPSLKLLSFDIDSGDVSDSDRQRYNLEVPVLFIKNVKTNSIFELPRASPRLNEELLHDWLQKKLLDYPDLI